MVGYRSLVFYQKAQEVMKGANQLINNWSNSMQAQVISRQHFGLLHLLAQTSRKDMDTTMELNNPLSHHRPGISE